MNYSEPENENKFVQLMIYADETVWVTFQYDFGLL